MTEVSTRLRAARERAGLTIRDISASTKLAPAVLLAIERGDFAKLPGDFYTRAFLRTYARELHLSPDAIVDEFEAERQPAQPPPAGNLRRDEPRQVPAREPFLRVPWRRVVAIASSTGAVIVLVVVLLVVFVARNRSVATRTPEPGAVGTSGAAPVPASPLAPSARDVPVEKVVIEIQAAGPIWVTGAADGKRVLYRLLAPGERVTVEARDELAFRVGDAAAFTYSINGVAGKPLGDPGQVRDVMITRENYRTFHR